VNEPPVKERHLTVGKQLHESYEYARALCGMMAHALLLETPDGWQHAWFSIKVKKNSTRRAISEMTGASLNNVYGCGFSPNRQYADG